MASQGNSPPRKWRKTLSEKQNTRKTENPRLKFNKKRKFSCVSKENILPGSPPKSENFVLKMIITSIQSTDDAVSQLAYTLQLKQFLTNDNDTGIGAVILQKVIPRLFEFLQNDDAYGLQCDATRVLVKIASGTGERARMFVKRGGMQKLYELLTSRSDAVLEQVTLALGKLVVISSEIRRYVLGQGIAKALLQLLASDDTQKITVVQNIAFCVSRLCRGYIPDDCPILPVMIKLLSFQDMDVLGTTCWALVHYTRSKQEAAQAVVDHGVLPRLLQLLTDYSEGVAFTALVALCETMKVYNDHTLKVLDTLLPHLLAVLENKESTEISRRTACQTVANITAGHEEQIQAVMDAYIFPSLIGIMDCPDDTANIEATQAVCNATAEGTAEHIQALVQMGCVHSFGSLLCVDDDQILDMALDALMNILAMEEQEGRMDSFQILKSRHVVVLLQGLVDHNHQQIRQMACNLLEMFFNGNDELQAVEGNGDPQTDVD